MGLLDYLTTHAMDEDYAFVSERRQTREPSTPHRRIVAQLASLEVLGLCAQPREPGLVGRDLGTGRAHLVDQLGSVVLGADRVP